MTDYLGNEAKSLNIMNFKLTNGDDIVAVVARNDPKESYVVVEGGLLMNKYIDSGRSSITYSFEEWTPLAEDHVTMINRSNIVSYCSVNFSARKNYLSTVIQMYSEQHADNLEDDETADWLDDLDGKVKH